MLFDTGDTLQGTLICDLVARGDLDMPPPHPIIRAMNALGYDAAVPGNHDFDYGAAFFLDSFRHARFPLTCCNLLNKGDAAPRERSALPSHLVLSRRFTDTAGVPHDLRIGVIGCLPPKTLEWDHHLSVSYDIPDMVDSVRQELTTLRAKGCDLTVVLAHSGLDTPGTDGRENVLLALARLDGVDAVFGGHTHQAFPGPAGAALPDLDEKNGLYHGTPIVMSGTSASHLGVVDLSLAAMDKGRWQVTARSARLLPVRDGNRPALPPDPEIASISRATHDRAQGFMKQKVGETRRPLTSFFSLMANDSVLQLVADAQAAYLRDIRRRAGLPDLPILSAAAPFQTGAAGPDHYCHVPTGPLTQHSLADLYCYPNAFCAVLADGAALRTWLEHSASVFNRVTPGCPVVQPLLDDAVPGYSFDVISGVTYRIDLSQPARFDATSRLQNPEARRITDLRWNDAPVTDDMRFLVASNSFRAHGTGFRRDHGYETPPAIVLEAATWNRDILRDYVQRHSPLDIAPRPIWSFAPLGGARALMRTAPAARAYLDDPALPLVEDLGDTEEGYMLLRLTL